MIKRMFASEIEPSTTFAPITYSALEVPATAINHKTQIPGYFVTEEKLQECFEAHAETDTSDEGTCSYKYQGFKDWLKQQGES